jgi:hypothetical protein
MDLSELLAKIKERIRGTFWKLRMAVKKNNPHSEELRENFII